MPQIIDKQPQRQVHLGIWEINESLEQLEQLWFTPAEGKPKLPLLMEIRNNQRKKEILATRLLLRQLQPGSPPDVHYDKWGKPVLPGNNGFISISHCHTHAAILVHQNCESGIDIEIISPRILNIAQRFMSQEEWNYHDKSRELELLHLIWAAKECIYKIQGRHGVIFKDHIFVHPFKPADNGNLSVTLKKNTVICDYNLHYQNDGEKVIVYGWQEKNACRSGN